MRLLSLVFVFFIFSSRCLADSSNTQLWTSLIGDFKSDSYTFTAETQYRFLTIGDHLKSLWRGTYKSGIFHYGLAYYDNIAEDFEIRPYLGLELRGKKIQNRLYFEERIINNNLAISRLRHRFQYKLWNFLSVYEETFHEINRNLFSELRLGLEFSYDFTDFKVFLKPSLFTMKGNVPQHIYHFGLYKEF